MKIRNFLFVLRYHSRVVLLLLCFASPFAYATFAQSPGEDAGKQLAKTLREARINTVVMSDFVDDGGHVTSEEVLLADRLSFALLEEQGFQALNRDRLNMHLHGPTPKNEALEGAAMNAPLRLLNTQTRLEKIRPKEKLSSLQ
jgi:hypothetical protein